MKNYEEYPMNKDAAITASQIRVMWHYISVTILLAKQVHLSKVDAFFFFCPSCKSVHNKVAYKMSSSLFSMYLAKTQNKYTANPVIYKMYVCI